jgi:hypothetical protein
MSDGPIIGVGWLTPPKGEVAPNARQVSLLVSISCHALHRVANSHLNAMAAMHSPLVIGEEKWM